MVKIEICKNVSFSTEKNWHFRIKYPKGATFTVYNLNIPICKCKDDFSSFSGFIHLFSGSQELLCDMNKNIPHVSRYIHQKTQCPSGPPKARDRGSGGPRAGSVRGRKRPGKRNSYNLPKKEAGINVNFQQNTALYSKYKYGMIALQNMGPGIRFLAGFSRFPKNFQTLYERGMQLWQIWI